MEQQNESFVLNQSCIDLSSAVSDLDLYNVRNQELIMGGDVCLWAEYADDDMILTRLWPRASAAAERLWSAKTVKNMEEAGPRIEEQRCRMKRSVT